MKINLAMLLLAIGCIGTAKAAEKVRYEEAPTRIAPFGTVIEHRSVKVVLLDGTILSGSSLSLQPFDLVLYRKNDIPESIPSNGIARIEIKTRGGHFADSTLSTAALAVLAPILMCTDSARVACRVFSTMLIAPPAFALAAVSAPFTLAADGVTLLTPPKVYEIVH